MNDSIITPSEIKINYGGKAKHYKVIKKPIPHIIIDSSKEIHGWWDSKYPHGKRACTSERLLLNPYNGCMFDCLFCYTKVLWGYFSQFRKHGIITVVNDFDKKVAKQLDNLNIASCGYLSPVTDPFQLINLKYQLTEKLIEVFLERNLPCETITKGKMSDRAIKLLSEHEYSFGQVTIISQNKEFNDFLIKGYGVSNNTLFNNIKRMADNNIYSVCRIDPIIPYLTDNLKELKSIIIQAKEMGANHIGCSILDIPKQMKSEILNYLNQLQPDLSSKLNRLYSENIGNDFHADIKYRKNIFMQLKNICEKEKITFSTCMEFEIVGKSNGNQILRNLNYDYMTSINCEGINIPIFERKNKNEKFKPMNCMGNCLTCKENKPPCKIDELKNAGNWKLRDYKRWSKIIGNNNATLYSDNINNTRWNFNEGRKRKEDQIITNP